MALTPTSSRAIGVRTQVLYDALGFGGQVFDYSTATQVLEPDNGRIYLGLVGLNAGDVVTNVLQVVEDAAAGTPPTRIRLGLASSAGVIVARTAEVQAAAGWKVGGAVVVNALSAPYVVPATGGYYLCSIQVGAWGTTAVGLRARTAGAGFYFAIGSGPPWYGNTGGGDSDLPAVASPLPVYDEAGSIPWLGWS